MVTSIPDPAKLEDLVMDKLRADKSPDLVRCVNKYAVFFLEELKHFLRIHGFVKSDLPLLPSPATQWKSTKP